MSVTFSAAVVDADGKHTFLAPPGWKPEYEEWPDAGMQAQSNDNPWELNVSNTRFTQLAAAIGAPLDMGDELCGEVADLEAFRASVAKCLAINVLREADHDVLNTTYLAERCRKLLMIIEAAIAHGGRVIWG